MTHRLFAAAFVAVILLSPFALAGGKVKKAVIVQGQTFPPQIAIVVDSSGSMTGQPYAQALIEAGKIAKLVTDEGRVRFYAFDNELHADPQGWIKMPDLDAIQRGLKYLADCESSGGTVLSVAMTKVLADEASPLGVVIITDCATYGGAQQDAKTIMALNAERKEPAVIGVLAINPAQDHEGLGTVVATQSGGAYVRLTLPPPPPKEEDAK